MTSIAQYIDSFPIKAVERIDDVNNRIKYSSRISSSQNIEQIKGDEERVRAIILTKLVNELGYPLDRIELETVYQMGRPKVINPRADIIVRDVNGDAFLFIELKAPDIFEEDQDKVIEQQLFNLAGADIARGHKVKYLVLLSCSLSEDGFPNKAIVIDHDKFSSFAAWKESREAVDELPANYGRAKKLLT